jgi:hypothetical protein
MSAHQAKLLKIRPQSLPGFIYLVQAVGTNKFKIGKATDVIKRIRGLQTGSPLKVRYVYHAYVHNTNLCEMELHNKFSSQREIGEWFSLTPEEVKFCILLMRLLQEPEPLEKEEESESIKLVEVVAVLSEELAAHVSTRQQEQIESILQCYARGITGKNKILKEVWGVSAGSSQAYRDAKAEYEYLLPFVKGGGGESESENQ